MIFAAPWVLLALAALPLLWWLLRVTPPAPRREVFPAVRLLLGLESVAETPARTPWWLLLLRALAAGLLIAGIARPVLNAGQRLPGSGPVLLAIDDGWASAADWARRMQAANAVLDRAERDGRAAALLPTAPADDGKVQATAAMPVADLRPRLAALRPKPWAVDRAAATRALAGRAGTGAAVYLADGLTDGGDYAAFAAALSAVGPLTELRDAIPGARLLLPPRTEADRLVLRVAQTPRGLESSAAVLAQASDGRTLARAPVTLPAGASVGEAALRLPLEVRNRVAAVRLDGQASAGSVVLLDERWRRRPVGIVAGDATTAETPLTGQAFYLRRALDPYTEVNEGDLDALLARDISVLVLADRVVTDAERAKIDAWVQHGGLLVRFAGPLTAGHADGLLPVRLLEGDRQLGGAMSWSQPAGLAAFPPGSPFSGLTVPGDVRVTRQVLAEPGPHLAEQTWAKLSDGTPLVTSGPHGAGRIVLFHVTANADWSDLPLSGLFVDMLRRLVSLSAGVAGDTAAAIPLAPAAALDGFGELTPPPSSAAPLPAGELAATPAGPRHPPGLYGPESGRRALNLSAHVPPPEAAPAIAEAVVESLGGTAQEQPIGPWLIALALALLAIDLLLSLRLRGLLRASAAAAVLLAMLAGPSKAQEMEQNPALITRLAYIVTGDSQLDAVSRMGLAGLSEYVNRRTAAVLGDPAPVTPGQDDLSFYPLIYWPISADASALPGEAIAALNGFMAHGGILLIDTRGGGSGAGFAAGAAEALPDLTRGLTVPPLAPLTSAHVLARSFYLLQEYPGRYAGDTVWVGRDQDRSNDSVSPVIIGGHDWAAAWAIDNNGRNPFATIPGGARQRTLAYRFGVNLVMYALTGNYKGDQVHVPSLLERLGQ